MPRTKTTHNNIDGRRFHFGGRRIKLQGSNVGKVWHATVGALVVTLNWRRGGVVNWIARVEFAHYVTDPDITEHGPDHMRIAVTRGMRTPEEAIAATYLLSVEAFTKLGDALNYDVEQ